MTATRQWRSDVSGTTVNVSDPNKAAATSDAQHLLGIVEVPQGWTSVSRPPSRCLDAPDFAEATPNLVDLYEFWTTGGSWQEVQAWAVAHRPAGSTQSESGTLTQDMVLSSGIGFAYPAIANRFASRQLVIEVAPLPHGGAGVRLDAQVIWYPSRSKAELVPPGTTTVTATVFSRTNGTASTTAVLAEETFTTPSVVQRLARKVDSLPLVIPGTTALCPDVFGPQVELVFSGRPGVPKVVVSDDPVGCGTVSFTIAKTAEAPLTDDGLTRQVEKLLGLPTALRAGKPPGT
jgi:hypothetical protein